MNTKKAAPQDDIPVKILKLNNDIFSQYLSQIFNERHKITIDTKKNYRPVSITSAISKILERCLYDQIYENIDYRLSRHQMGHRKGHSSQHSLTAMFKKGRKI